MSHFPVSLPVSHPPLSLSLSVRVVQASRTPYFLLFFFFFFPLLCSPLSAVLSSLCVSRWPNRQICSFSTGLWISHNRPQILSPDSVLPGWEAKQREEERERRNGSVLQSGTRKRSYFKELLQCLHMASCVSLYCVCVCWK